jgi:hypothetical protein
MSNLYRGLAIDASYQVSYHLAKRFQRKSCLKSHFDPLTNMAAAGNSCFRLVDFYEYSSLKLLGQSELKFGGKHLWKVLY